jgi:hypothetical protein
VADLSAWISDDGDQVVSINLNDSVGSNRYYGDIKTKIGRSKKDNLYIYTDDSCDIENLLCTNFGPRSFGYRLIGEMKNGVIVLYTAQSGGGSGNFRSLVFVSIEKDRGLTSSDGTNTLRLARERWLIKKLGEEILGDHDEGKITIEGNTLHIDADHRKNGDANIDKAQTITIELSP